MGQEEIETYEMPNKYNRPELTPEHIGVLDVGLKMYQGDADALCHAICKLHNKRQYNTLVTKEKQSGKDIVQVFDMVEIKERHDNLSSAERNIKAILKKFNLKEDTGYRELMPITKKVIDGIKKLKKSYPNCLEFLDYVDQFAILSLCRAGTRRMHFPPVILAGPPGVGKTAIVREVAKLLKVPCKQLDMASVTSSFVISGMSSAWSEAKAGSIVDLLRDGHAANPIVILDELDKCTKDNRYDPLGGLYTLLEKEAAENFTDEALDMPINASHILYVATANDLAEIPAPMLSRFLVINIDDVKGEHHRTVTQSIYQSLLKQEGMERAFTETLHDEIFERMEPYSPREVKRLLLRAMAHAAYRKKQNFSVDICEEDLVFPEENANTKMGFIW